jgi:hypothetical protein
VPKVSAAGTSNEPGVTAPKHPPDGPLRPGIDAPLSEWQAHVTALGFTDIAGLSVRQLKAVLDLYDFVKRAGVWRKSDPQAETVQAIRVAGAGT